MIFIYSLIFAILLLKKEYYLCVYDIRTTLIPKESNFFDTNPLGFLLEKNPSGIETFMFLCVSKCY